MTYCQSDLALITTKYLVITPIWSLSEILSLACTRSRLTSSQGRRTSLLAIAKREIERGSGQ